MAGEMKELAQTTLGESILCGHIGTVRSLIEQGEDTKFKDRKGNTYLHLVCTTYRPYIFHSLVASGIDIDAQNKDGNTALHVTAIHEECGHVTDLLAYDVNTSLKNKDGKTAAELKPKSKFWKQMYDLYNPGVREAVANRHEKKLTHFLKTWIAVDRKRDGKDLRQQAARDKQHHLVAIIDKYRFSLMAVYAVLEGNYKKLEFALSRGKECDVNFLQQVPGCHPVHILQHALRQKDQRMVTMLMKAGTNVNTRVHIQHYVMGPLYFEAIKFGEHAIIREVMYGHADVDAKDERGRNALIYTIDQAPEEVKAELVDYILKENVNIAHRDDTGCTARDIAMLARRHDIVVKIDQFLVCLIKESNMPALQSLAKHGYDNFFIEFNMRDSWIYAAGNETEDVTKFLQSLENYKNTVKELQEAIISSNLPEIKSLLNNYSVGDIEMLLQAKDKGGRGMLTLAVLWDRQDVVTYLLNHHLGNIDINETDNRDRRPLHYACVLNNSKIRNILLQNRASPCCKDTLDLYPQGYAAFDDKKKLDFIEKERKLLCALIKNEKYNLDSMAQKLIF